MIRFTEYKPLQLQSVPEGWHALFLGTDGTDRYAYSLPVVAMAICEVCAKERKEKEPFRVTWKDQSIEAVVLTPDDEGFFAYAIAGSEHGGTYKGMLPRAEAEKWVLEQNSQKIPQGG